MRNICCIAAVLLLAGAIPGLARIHDVGLPDGGSMRFVWIESGTFTMGTTQAQQDKLESRGLWTGQIASTEQPATGVEIDQGFWLGVGEVSQGQWMSVMGQASQPWVGRSLYTPSGSLYPAVGVDTTMVRDFLAEMDLAVADSVFRLPTEAEWEYACRAGDQDELWSFGDDEVAGDDSVAVHYAQYGANPVLPPHLHDGKVTAPIMSLEPNEWGLHDMHGNVHEWTKTPPHAYPYNPQAPENGLRIIRGGNFGYPAVMIRSAFRGTGAHGWWRGDVGFRVLMTRLPTIGMDIDVKPGSDDNPINLKSRGVIPVAILGSSKVDVSKVDGKSVRCGPGEARPAHGGGHIEDVNGDGAEDLVLHFRAQDAGLGSSDTHVILVGQLTDGTPIEGADSISIVGGGKTRRGKPVVDDGISWGEVKKSTR